MINLEKWRAHARYCVLMAEKTAEPEAKRTWQILAEGWLKMLPLFEDRDSGQEPGMSQY
jgi:hypothetical protein